MAHKVKPTRYAYLTVGWAVCLILSAIADQSALIRTVVPLTFSGLMIAGVLGMSGNRARLWFSGCSGALWLASIWMFYAIGHPILTVTMALLGVVFIAFIAYSILSDFLNAKRITADILWGTIGVYLLIATAYSLLFSAIDVVTPGALSESAGQSTYIYFSFVTMTTLGYGDIVPVSGLARLLASFTAISGVMYTAVVVSRLVAIEVMSAGRPEDDDTK